MFRLHLLCMTGGAGETGTLNHGVMMQVVTEVDPIVIEDVAILIYVGVAPWLLACFVGYFCMRLSAVAMGDERNKLGHGADLSLHESDQSWLVMALDAGDFTVGAVLPGVKELFHVVAGLAETRVLGNGEGKTAQADQRDHDADDYSDTGTAPREQADVRNGYRAVKVLDEVR